YRATSTIRSSCRGCLAPATGPGSPGWRRRSSPRATSGVVPRRNDRSSVSFREGFELCGALRQDPLDRPPQDPPPELPQRPERRVQLLGPFEPGAALVVGAKLEPRDSADRPAVVPDRDRAAFVPADDLH